MSAMAMGLRRPPGIAGMPGALGLVEVVRRRVPHIVVLTILFAALDVARAFPFLIDSGGLGMVFNIVLQKLIDSAAVVAAISAAERTGFAQAHRAIALTLTVVVAAPIASAMGVAITEALQVSRVGMEDLLATYLYDVWNALVTGFLAAAYFTMWERAQRTASRLRAAEIEHQGVQQRVVESRLNVMKARVDPEFLFRMIRDIQRLYRGDTDAAEARLEDLIQYLRAALPQMRGGATTLGEEIHLAAAYLRLHEDNPGARLSCTFDVDEALESAQFPPMALLPLIDDALRRAASGSLALRVKAVKNERRIAVSIEDDCAQPRLGVQGNDALVEHERAFCQFFGLGARVERAAAQPAGTRVTLEIKHAVAASPDR